MSAITKYLPKRKMSRLVGHLMHWQGPRWWARFSVQNFARFYKINLEEAEKPFHEYPSIGEFFIRKLKADKRPIANSWAVHPADSRITQCAPIVEGKLIQAKGWTYSLEDFTQDRKAMDKWREGIFLTYYLCPTDYHRVHSPVDGVITDVRYMPGKLWPVNDWSTANIENLFAINERISVEIQTDLGPVAVVFVGATNVGHIVMSFDAHFEANRPGAHVHIFEHKNYHKGIAIKRGQELGMFRMGSTVVTIYPKSFRDKFENVLDRGPIVQVNAALTNDQ